MNRRKPRKPNSQGLQNNSDTEAGPLPTCEYRWPSKTTIPLLTELRCDGTRCTSALVPLSVHDLFDSTLLVQCHVVEHNGPEIVFVLVLPKRKNDMTRTGQHVTVESTMEDKVSHLVFGIKEALHLVLAIALVFLEVLL